MKHLLALIVFTILLGCEAVNRENTATKDTSKEDTRTKFSYKVNAPEKSFELDEKLLEISGVALDEDEATAFAIQDENGIIFNLSLENGTILDSSKFRKNGDYEDIEVIGDTLYIVKSSGTIYELTDYNTPNQTLETYNDFLDDEDDVEGLCRGLSSNELLLITKANGNLPKHQRGIYTFDRTTKKLAEQPIIIDLKEIASFLTKNYSERELKDNFSKFLGTSEDYQFGPSALAWHEEDNHLYILSSVGKILLVTTPKGEIIHVEKLDKTVHRQPEGIDFMRDGTMLISNEGKDGRPATLHFIKEQ